MVFRTLQLLDFLLGITLALGVLDKPLRSKAAIAEDALALAARDWMDRYVSAVVALERVQAVEIVLVLDEVAPELDRTDPLDDLSNVVLAHGVSSHFHF